jgi:NodT family efflux transporter outer membrane factor (OMF) lipoprotein
MTKPADAETVLAHWWQGFDDPVLDRLVDRALTQNLDLKILDQRVIEAKADRETAASYLYPQVGLGGSAERTRPSQAAKFPPPGLIGTYNNYQASLNVSWELDLFGKNRRAVESADAAVEATVENRRAVLVSLLGELGVDYATMRESQAREAIALSNVQAAEDSLMIAQQRFQHGLGSELDVAEAKAQVDNVRAQVPVLQTAEAQSIHAIAVLLGDTADAIEADLKAPAAKPLAAPMPPLMLPSQVVRNRPDIRQAERQIQVDNAQIGVAVAETYPDFTIGPTVGTQAETLHRLISGPALIWSLAGSVSQPIFEGGRLDAQIDKAKAATEADRLAYRKTVLQAFQEVEDALVALDSERNRQKDLDDQVEADRLALVRATEAYRGGFGDFLSVLDAERSLYAAEDEKAQSDLNVAQQTVTLYKALGGGWQAGEGA